MSRAVILAPFDDSQMKRLSQRVEVTLESWFDTRIIYDPSELGQRLREQAIDILVIEADFAFAELFEQAEELKFVGVCHSGLEHVEVDAATEAGVLVVNTPGRNARAVAEHALALMLALAKNVAVSDRYVRSGQWQDPVDPYINMRGIEFEGRVLGIVGMGSIGGELARLATALGMNVVAFDPFVSRCNGLATMTTLEDLTRTADFISIHVPVTASTTGMLNATLVNSMRQDAFIINCSDIAVVDQQALVTSLRGGAIAGAGFDVFESHPIAPDSPLLELENVILTPHIGGATAETIERHSRMLTDDIFRFLDGKRPSYLVNPQAWKDRE